jgi:hypothetical protein
MDFGNLRILKSPRQKCLDYLVRALDAWKTNASTPAIFSQAYYGV